MIQDIYPHRLHNEYQTSARACNDDLAVCISDGGIAVHTQGSTLRFPSVGEYMSCCGDDKPEVTYLFRLDETSFFMIHTKQPHIPEGCSVLPVRTLQREYPGPRELIFAAYTAGHLARWYDDNRFCGTCGHPTIHSDKERALVCPSCRRTIYPRIVPAVIVGVLDHDRILLTQYAGRSSTFYALVAGFTEIGETLEQTVEREVMEEVGLKVKNIRYYKSQPWGIADDILMGFYCDVDGDSTIRLDLNELKEGSWFRREDVILQPNDFSLTNEMMKMFKEGLI